MNRRALLAAFLAAPAAVKLAPWMRPATMTVEALPYWTVVREFADRVEVFPFYAGYGANDTWTPHG